MADESREWEAWRVPYRAELPTPQQVATLLAALTLASPAMLGGIPVLPVTVNDERRRQQEEIIQESDSSVGVHQSVQEAATALSLSQRRLAQVTREIEGIHTHDLEEADVVNAARRVAAGESSVRQRREFRAALGRVAYDSVDLFILLDDEGADDDWSRDGLEDEEPFDEDAWIAEFE